MGFVKTVLTGFGGLIAAAALTMPLHAAQLGNEARSVVPHDLQQLIVVDYRAMQNSPSAMQLRARILPPELKRLEDALKTSGMNENQDVEQLAFASFRSGGTDNTKIIGIAQGQFQTTQILASFKKQKITGKKIRTTTIYPMGASGMLVTFLNPTTMIFGDEDGMKAMLDARDGLAPNMQTNSAMMDLIPAIEGSAVWSILDQKGTQYMMHSLLGDATQVADYETVKKRLLSSRYGMDFDHGVKFNLDVFTPDAFSAATMSSLLNAAALYRKTTTAEASEKQALASTDVTSNNGTLEVRFKASDSDFASLLKSDLFQSVVK
jgi:hypothetical protein